MLDRTVPRLLLALSLFCLAMVPAERAGALTIIGNFVENPGPEPADTFGTGNIPDIFDAAAGQWERAIADERTVTISYTWAFLGSGTLGVGLPASPTSGFINFNNRDTPWFLDATPDEDSEFTDFSSTSLFLAGGDGDMNVGRQFEGATGDAASGFDLFSVAMHEIGHILDLGQISPPFAAETVDGDIDLTSPLPFAGAEIPTTEVGGGHIDIPTALMNPFSSFAERTLLAEVDILAVAQINGYSQLDLDPARVPEPGTLVYGMAVCVALLGSGRRRLR